ncbi:hypothetical protein HMP09_0281 [Sphingomonas sp. HMP9]|uniref:FkbM family methyltransferase n=1 Tax=Sphingomonas sp. HMP9 TaxID=1517554 RepID=UPI0015970F74|nr:FkbM family methyltransferase [Sphingomonas sp. HMP9]BCA61047.1 hypothetical protein HMP09_0281 [Sphingomonas sp. HMP9]
MLPKPFRRAIFLTKKATKGTIGRTLPTATLKKWRFLYASFQAKLGRDYFPSNDGLDRKLLQYIGGIKNGVFIEAGANDGLSQSNTWHLEKRLGWTGLLVEPTPHIAKMCKAFRGRSTVENCALGSFEQDGDELELHYGGLMTVADGADTSHMFGGSAETHAKSGASWTGDKPYRFKSQMNSLTGLLLKNGIKRADLLSLDVEGFEVQALQGLDVSRTPVTYILVETSNLAAVRLVLDPDYDYVTNLSRHDYLFKLKVA